MFKDYLNDGVCLTSLVVLGIVIGTFGATNWHCGLTPERIRTIHNGWSSDQVVTVFNDDQYEQEMEWRRQNAVIPLAYAVPLTFGGFAMAISCGIALLNKMAR